MKLALLASLAFCCCAPAQILNPILSGSFNTTPTTCGGNGFAHCRIITFTPPSGVTASVANFVGLVNFTEADWGTSGAVTHSGNQSGGSYTSTIPYDFVFTSDSACMTPVAGWEFESYTTSTGAVIAWVDIGTLAANPTATNIYACVGKSSITTQQNTVTSTWAAFNHVYHLPNGSTLSAVDSGASAINGTINSVTATSGEIDGAGSFAGASGDYISVPTLISLSRPYSWSAWIYITAATGSKYIASDSDSGAANFSYGLRYVNSTGLVSVLFSNASGPASSASTVSTGAWHHVVGVVSTTALTCYLDGVAGTPISDTNTPPAGTSGSIGRLGAFVGDSWDGLLDEVRETNTALSASAVIAMYNQEVSGQTMVTIGAEN